MKKTVGKNKKISVFNLTATAAMVAMSVVLCRYLGFSPENSPLRFEIGFLPIAFVGHIFGFAYSGIAYLLSDAIGSLLSGYAPNPAIALCQLLFGMTMGFSFKGRKMNLARISICMTFIAIVIEFLAKTPIFIFYYGYTAEAAFAMRGLNALVNLPIRIAVLYISAKASEKPIERIIRKMNITKNDFKAYANSFQAVTIPGLERISTLLSMFGNPERQLKFIHVAGTNGKGSTCSAIAEILSAKGYKTGKYISPNLVKVNERISICGTDIKDDELDILLSRIEPLSDGVKEKTGLAPTQFEIWTAAAMVYFAEMKCDYVVLEVGLGGEFDATNVIPNNEIAVITRLGFDHTQYLGDTIAEIAHAKAGIIKKDSKTGIVVTVEQEKTALEVIKEKAESVGSRVVIPSPIHVGTSGIYEIFSIDGIENLVCGIAGLHQIENMALAAETARCLGIEDEYIKIGIARAKNPARFELIQEAPTVIYDGGHNENGIEALTRSIDKYFGNTEKVVIFACMKDKEISESLSMLNTADTEFIFTEVKNNPRADSAEGTLERARKSNVDGMAIPDIGEAYEEALRRGKLTIICGSLYLYKDLQEYFNKRNER